MNVRTHRPVLLYSALLGTLLSTTGSHAAAPSTAAVSSCQPALPTYDGNIRKRPKAVQNEGTATAFVTCGFSGDLFFSGSNGMYEAAVILVNTTAGPLDVSCTLVPGPTATVVGGYLAQTRTLSPGTVSEGLFWSSANYGSGRFGVYASVSCALPPGAGIAEVFSFY